MRNTKEPWKDTCMDISSYIKRINEKKNWVSLEGPRLWN